MIDLGKQWPLNISFFADKCKCLVFANLDATEPPESLLDILSLYNSALYSTILFRQTTQLTKIFN